METLTKLLTYLKSFPAWLRAVILALIAGLIFCFSLTSCGQTVRVTVRDTSSGVEVSTTQNRKDTTGTNITVNPTVNYNKP